MARTPAGAERLSAVEIAATCACFNLRKAARAVTQLYDDALRPTGLRITQFTLLTLVGGLGTISVTRLASAAVMDYTTLVRNLKLLERQGLVRSRATQDKRVREVSLTDRGRRALAPALPLWEKAQARVTSQLSRQRFGRLLADLSAAVEAAHGP
jgi:DNA-binding MarR family transcriptional regulator